MSSDASKPAAKGDDISLEGLVIADIYELGPTLGRGAMGEVYRGRNLETDAQVAVKMLHREWVSDEVVRARFLRESEVLAELSHPNIVRLLETGELGDGTLFLIMDYVEGIRLDVALGNRAMSQEFTLELGRQIGMALDAAHAKGIIHRDVKPQNIYITADAGQLHFKLLDFGLARPTETSDLTAENAICGTPLYISPEQSLGRGVCEQSDFYSLGVVLYQTLSGQPPFRFRSLIQLLVAHAESSVPPLSETAAHAKPQVVAWIESLLLKDPEARPASGAIIAGSAALFLNQMLDLSSTEFDGSALDLAQWVIDDATHQEAPENTSQTLIDGVPMWARFAEGHFEDFAEMNPIDRANLCGWGRTPSKHFREAMEPPAKGQRFAIALVAALNADVPPAKLESRVVAVTSNAINQNDLAYLTSFLKRFLNGIKSSETRRVVARLVFNADNLNRTMRLMENQVVQDADAGFWSDVFSRCPAEILGRVLDALTQVRLRNANLFSRYILEQGSMYGAELGRLIVELPEPNALNIIASFRDKGITTDAGLIGEVAKHKSPKVRQAVVLALTNSFGVEAKPFLSLLADDSEKTVRTIATDRLRELEELA